MSEFVLTKYDAMRQAIVQAHSIDDVKDIRDKAEALRQYAKQAGESLENQNMIAEIKLRAERKAGELLREMPRQEAGRPEKNSNTALPFSPPPKLDDLGITRMQSSRFQAIATIPEPLFEQHIADTKADSKELTSAGVLEIAKQRKRQEREDKREQRRKENAAKAAQTPDPIAVGARFSTILIDPPWDWGDEGDINQMGRAKPDYSTMSLEALMALPVGEMSDSDCHIYLWITNRSLPKGFLLLDTWGFRYVTCLTWVKPHFGMGNYFRGQTEHILFGVKGSQSLKRHDVGTVFHAERGPNGHSSKPPMIYDLIESCSPGPYLEMFARTKRASWSAWGADAE